MEHNWERDEFPDVFGRLPNDIYTLYVSKHVGPDNLFNTKHGVWMDCSEDIPNNLVNIWVFGH